MNLFCHSFNCYSSLNPEYQKFGFEIEDITDSPLVNETPSGSPMATAMPSEAASEDSQAAKEEKKTRFNSEVKVIGTREGAKTEKVISLNDALGLNYRLATHFSTPTYLRPVVGRAHDTYETERLRIERIATFLAKGKIDRLTTIQMRRFMNQANKAKEIFSREELNGLLESASRGREKKLDELTTREILAKFRRFADKRSKVSSQEPKVRIKQIRRDGVFLLEYERIPKDDLKFFQDQQRMDEACFKGDLVEWLHSLRTNNSMGIIHGDRLTQGIGGYIAIFYKNGKLCARHLQAMDKNQILSTTLLKSFRLKEIYPSFQAFFDAHGQPFPAAPFRK